MTTTPDPRHYHRHQDHRSAPCTIIMLHQIRTPDENKSFPPTAVRRTSVRRYSMTDRTTLSEDLGRRNSGKFCREFFEIISVDRLLQLWMENPSASVESLTATHQSSIPDQAQPQWLLNNLYQVGIHCTWHDLIMPRAMNNHKLYPP